MALLERTPTPEISEASERLPHSDPLKSIGPRREPTALNQQSRVRVLVVDDSLLTRKYLERVLFKSGLCTDVLLAESGEQGLDLLRQSPVDLVLCDINMAGLSGFEFLTRMRANLALNEVPVIMLTGEEDSQWKLDCLESGASDFLFKPVVDRELVARARIHLQLKCLQDELRRKNQQLVELARLDSLTGIPNRHYFFECVERALGRARRVGEPVALAMIDIDHFKKVNDDFGHLCGDQALIEVAARMKSGLRDYDLLGRYGGEEFAAVFVDTGADAAVVAAERCRRRVAEEPMNLAGRDLEITVSIGVASTTEPKRGLVTDLIARADEALYLAKNRGRNRVVSSPRGSSAAGDFSEGRAR